MVMNKMRESAKWFFFVLIGAFIITIIFEWGMDFNGQRSSGKDVGAINGKSISIQQYEQMCRAYSDNYRQQSKGAEIDENMENSLREQAWNALIEQQLFQDELKKLNISVSDEEIVAAINSDNPPEMISRQFRDPKTGQINKAALQQAISDPQNKQAWIQVEGYVRQQKQQEKLQAILGEAIQVSDAEARAKFELDKTKATGKYLLFDIATAKADSLYPISDGEISAYYRDKREDYKQEPSRTGRFVFFPLTPTGDDTLAIQKDLERIKQEFATTKNDSDFVRIHSDVEPALGKSFAHGSISKDIEDALYAGDLAVGKVIGPIRELGEMRLVKVTDLKEGDPTVRASHILLQPTAATKEDTAKVKAEAAALLAQIKSGKISFEQAAKEKSKDGSAQSGGDLGWFGKGRMVKPFEDAAFKGKVGELVGPVQTQFGIHLIKVTARETRDVKGVEITKKIVPSGATVSRIRTAAKEFQYYATSEGFEEEAKKKNYEIRQTGQFFKNGYIPGLGQSRSIMGFAFKAKVKGISEVIETKDGLSVMQLMDANDDGYRRLNDDLKAEIKSKLVREKKLAELRERAKKAYDQAGGDITKAATVEQGLVVRDVADATLANPFIAGLGRENALVGALIGMEKDKLSSPIDVTRGVALAVQTAKVTAADADFDAQKEELKKQILQEKKGQVLQNWVAGLKKKAKIEDNRLAFL
jgi:peptidyl-prolyl cis-trans isomerase D